MLLQSLELSSWYLLQTKLHLLPQGLVVGGSAVPAGVEAEPVPEHSCIRAACLIVLEALLYVMECNHQPFEWFCVH